MASKSSAVATKNSTAVATLDYADELASIAKRLQNTGSSDRIKTSNAKLFILPDKSEHEELDVIVVDFIAFNRNGVIRTYFRPADGEAYFQRQLRRKQ